MQFPSASLVRAAPTAVYRVDPLADARWDALVRKHPRSSVFHTSAWIGALQRTYGYQPLAFTTSPPGADLGNAVVFCRVSSWITGTRLVSLPFSDHCDVLVQDSEELAALAGELEKLQEREKDLRYIEVRARTPLAGALSGTSAAHTYCLHELDLSPSLDTLLHNLHKDSIQRKIRRAGREGLTYSEGRSTSFLDSFYRLMLLTRRRHGLPPQPKQWFRNLADGFGEALKIRIASKEGLPIAAILTLRHKDTLVYKYGCSDAQYHPLGGMHLLFWEAISEAKRDGLTAFDLGRSDFEDAGLIQFKDRWGAAQTSLTYLRLGSPARQDSKFQPAGSARIHRLGKRLFARLPDTVLVSAGNLFYRHIG